MLDTQRQYAATPFLTLKSIPNFSTKTNEFHLSLFRGKKMNTEPEKSVSESQLNHVLTLGQVLNIFDS